MSIFNKKKSEPIPEATPPPIVEPYVKQESKAERIYQERLAKMKLEQEVEDMENKKEFEEEQQKAAVANPPPVADRATANIADYEEDFIVYGSERNKKAKISISLNMLDGQVLGLPYERLMFWLLENNRLLSIYLPFGIIKITGVNLHLIEHRLKIHSLSFINEGGLKNTPVTPDGVAVYSITLEIAALQQSEG